MDEAMEYCVHSIAFNGAITVDYSYCKLNGKNSRLKIKLLERPHQDFTREYGNIKECFEQMIGFPIVDKLTGAKLDIIPTKVTFVESKNNGRGMKITAQIFGIEQHEKPTTLTTLPFYEIGLSVIDTITINGKEINRYRQQLNSFQILTMNNIKREAFEFAKYGKKEQPTLEEAAGLLAEGSD